MLNTAVGWFFLLGLLVLALSAHADTTKPRAVIHIGPRKTASSHIQKVLSDNRDLLATMNLFWPSYAQSHKSIVYFASALNSPEKDPTGSIPSMKNFIQSSKLHRQNVVISSEQFDMLTVSGAVRLKEILEGYDVSIVYVYREVLSHLISLHFQNNRDPTRFSIPFSSFLLEVLDHTPIEVDPLPLLNRMAGVFRRDSIKVIDLEGCAADQHDVAYVLLCEVGGVLCRNESFFNATLALGANAGYDLVPMEVFSHFSAMVEVYGDGKCFLCVPAHSSAYVAFVQRINAKMHALPPLPVQQSALHMLIPFAEQVDASLRADYGKHILHSNATANRAAMRSNVHVEWLDTEAFVQDYKWESWLRELLEEYRASGQLCGCAPLAP